jgi:molybdopterin-containing oxidoreductase family membrane subunit
VERPDPAIEEPLLRPVLSAGRAFWLTVAVLLGIMAFGGYHWGQQTRIGLGYTGETRPVYWGLYLVNYVFFIGISHAGTLISAILRLTHAEWRRPITRAAEAITVFALAMGASNVLWHLGRPERIWVPLVYPQFLSPLIWDVVCISTYLIGSTLYLYLPLVPDLALIRDRHPRFGWLYRPLALGWQGTERQHQLLEKAIGAMAVIIIPIAVSVHTVVSWVFAMTLLPMWHSTIFGPYFVVGAIFSGIAAILVAMAILRRAFHLEAFFRPVHFNNLGLLLLTLCCLWTYFTFAEHLTTWYGNVPDEMAVFRARVSGPFALPFWTMLACCFLIPFLILAFKKTRTIAGTVVASLSVLLGMWLERYVIVIGSASFPRLPFNWDHGNYTPALVEIAMTAAQFAAFTLMFAVFTRLFPIVSIWEVKEGAGAEVAS